MQKILMVSRIFAPDNSIGAIRPTKFAKYLSLNGYIVDVISEKEGKCAKDSLLLEDMCKLNKVIRISNSKNMIKIQNKIYDMYFSKKEHINKNFNKIQNHNLVNKFKSQLKKYAKCSLDIVNEYDYYIEFKKLNIDLQQYDYVFTTYSTTANHLIGKYIKKNNSHIKWIADFRDMMENNEYPYLYNKLLIKIEKEIVRLADVVTVVSEGQREIMLETIKYPVNNEKIRILYNGYDDELSNGFIKNNIPDKILKFVYTGALYNGRRDMYMLLKALSELISDNKIDKKNIQINYAGNDADILKIQSDMYGLTECIFNYGYISREKSMQLQKQSDILILLSWNTQKEKGILTGKFFEYMKQMKPIAAFVSGDTPNSELLNIINKLKLGICLEYANEENDYKLLKEYIYSQYILKSRGLTPVYEPNLEEIKRFHYKEIIKNLEKILLNLINDIL